MRRQAGFTLVEVLATGVISSVLAGVVLTLLYAGSSQVNEMVPRQQVISIYNLVSEQVHWTARRAYTVRSTNDGPFAVWPPTPAGPRTSQDGLVFYDRTGNVIGGYDIAPMGSTNYLREWKGLSFQPFKVAGDTVFVTPSLKFGHSNDRRSITFEILIRYVINGTTREYRTPTETAYLRGN